MEFLLSEMGEPGGGASCEKREIRSLILNMSSLRYFLDMVLLNKLNWMYKLVRHE